MHLTPGLLLSLSASRPRVDLCNLGMPVEKKPSRCVRPSACTGTWKYTLDLPEDGRLNSRMFRGIVPTVCDGSPHFATPLDRSTRAGLLHLETANQVPDALLSVVGGRGVYVDTCDGR
jgi:hypothetical protein